jgi:uncharacterized protein YpmS
MPRKIFLLVTFGGCFCGLVLIVLFGLYWASRYEPEFYRKALAADPSKQEKLSDEFIRQALALQNSLKREGSWQATFTAEQINAWLAVDLKRNHPQALPAEFSDPCVSIEPSKMQIACRYEGTTTSILCIAVEPYVSEPNVLALRIVHARAGKLPLPLGNVLDSISEAARNAECRLQWRQADGNPVAMVTFPPLGDKEKMTIEIKSVKLEEGKITISGRTKKSEK